VTGRRLVDEGRRPLDVARLAASAPEGWRVEVVPATGSTNADVLVRAGDGEPAGLVLLTEHQRAGRGRRDRAWVVPPRAALTLSVLLRPSAPAQTWSWLGLLGGVALCQTLRELGADAVLKWPNDVLVRSPRPPDADGGPPDGEGRAKVAGLLAEVASERGRPAAVVLGIGLNVDQDAVELPVPQASSLRLAGLRDAAGGPLDRTALAAALLARLHAWYRRWDGEAGDPVACGLLERYRSACDTPGRSVRVLLPGGGERVGLAVEVDGQGRLVVQGPGGPHDRQAHAVGDVVHIRPVEPA
jgi:BirA family biotin operon repressor/biotin-[acetyl-CoA-carboxylase] ligase